MTKQKNFEEQLDAATRRFRSLMDNCVDALIIINAGGTILDFNPAAENIFQYHSKEIVGRNISALMPEPYRSGHDGYLKNYLTTGEAKIIGNGREVVGRRKNGETFPMELSVGEMPDGGIRNFVGTVRDITHRRNIEDHEGADMIVMGSRGLGRVADIFLGSVSQKVSHLSKCTCVTVK